MIIEMQKIVTREQLMQQVFTHFSLSLARNHRKRTIDDLSDIHFSLVAFACTQVSDFGLSQVLPEGTNKTQVSMRYSGTVTHMPPELIEDGKVYQQGDVYAFGIMMWEVCDGCWADYAFCLCAWS